MKGHRKIVDELTFLVDSYTLRVKVQSTLYFVFITSYSKIPKKVAINSWEHYGSSDHHPFASEPSFHFVLGSAIPTQIIELQELLGDVVVSCFQWGKKSTWWYLVCEEMVLITDTCWNFTILDKIEFWNSGNWLVKFEVRWRTRTFFFKEML